MKRAELRMNTVLLLALTGTVALVLVVAIFLLLRSCRRSLLDNARTAGARMVAQVSGTANEYLNGIDNMRSVLREIPPDSGAEWESFLDALMKIRPDITAVSVCDAAGNIVRYDRRNGATRREPETHLFPVSGTMAESSDVFLSAPHVVSLPEGGNLWVVTAVFPLDGGGQWAAFDIRCGGLLSSIGGAGIGRRGYCFLMDTDGTLIYHPRPPFPSDSQEENTALISALKDGSHTERGVIYTVQTLRGGQWRMVGVTFEQELRAEAFSDLGTVLAFSILMVITAALVLSAILYRVLSRPVWGLISAMEQFERDTDHYVYQPVRGAWEVRRLSESFGHMVGQIQHLVDTVRAEELNLRKTELRALQAQINPHFLYNTLDSISWMCEQGKNADAVRMVNALARLFRISISRGQELIPIRNELRHAESYLQIQSYRYKNQFVYRFDADTECLDYLCNKITLQPVIENAIYHGLNGLVDEGEISVSVKSDGGDVVFTVADNGMGMSEEQIAAVLNKERSDRAGIGIKNVDDRLKIYFGPPYGITIESVPDEGTQVHIRMPKVTAENCKLYTNTGRNF